MERGLISRKEAAKKLGISITVLDEARKSGQISFIQYVKNGSVYFTEAALQDYISRNTYRAKPLGNQETYRKIRKKKER